MCGQRIRRMRWLTIRSRHRVGLCLPCKEKRDALVIQWKGLPIFVAHKLWGWPGVRETIPNFVDLVSLGWEPLIRSAELYDPADPSHASFTTYATNAILKTMSRELHTYRSPIYIPSYVIDALRCRRAGKPPHQEASETVMAHAVATMGRERLTIDDDFVGGDEPQDDDPLVHRLRELMAGLPKKDRQLLRRLFWDDHSYRRIGRDCKISDVAVRNRCRKILRKLKEQLRR